MTHQPHCILQRFHDFPIARRDHPGKGRILVRDGEIEIAIDQAGKIARPIEQHDQCHIFADFNHRFIFMNVHKQPPFNIIQ